MRNNNQNVIKRLSRQSLKNNKVRNRFSIMAMILTTVLFTTLFTLSMGMIKSVQEQTMRQAGGSAHAALKGITDEEYNNMKNHPLIKDIGYSVFVGIAENEALIKRQTEVRFATENLATYYFSYPTEGEMPQKINEIATDTLVLDMLGIPHEIGASVTLVYSVNGETFTRDFVLSGYWEGDVVPPASQVWVSQAFMDEHFANIDQQFQKQQHRYSGLIFADIMFENSFNIEEKIQTVITESGYELKEIEYGVNWAYMSTNFSTVDFSTVVVMISATLLILFTGYLIIYNIFYISVTKEIRFYGLLKTIGTTSKQIRKLVRKQAYFLSIIGIPIGLLLGYLLGVMLLPFIVKITGIHNVRLSANPIIFLGAALFSLITVAMSSRKPSQIAAKVSPIEAVRYTGVQLPFKKKRKKSTNGAKIHKMACSNLFRNKKKTFVVIVSMSLSLMLFNAVYTVTVGFDLDEFLSDRVVSDFLVGHVDYFNDHFRNEEDMPSQQLIDELNHIGGIERSGKTYHAFRLHSLSSVGMQNLNDIYPDEYLQQLDAIDKNSIAQMKKTGEVSLQIYGLNDFLFEKLEIVEGELDYEKLETGKYIFVNIPKGSEEANHQSYYNIGDKVTITFDDNTEKTYEVMGMANMSYQMSIRRGSPEDFICFLPESEFLSQVKNPMFINYAFDVADEKTEEMEKFLENYTQHIEPMMSYTSKQTYMDQFKQLQRTFFIVGGVLSVIVGLIGILNFINAMLTSVMTRRREFAMLKSIGMTSKQLKKMMMFEGIYHAIFTIAITLTGGYVISYLIVNALAEQIWFFKDQLTLLPVFIAAPIILVISVMIPFIAYQGSNRQTLVEQLRKGE